MSVEAVQTVLVAATATAPADPYDLTDLATARDELGIEDPADTSHDTFIQRVITQGSHAIAKYCNRTFPVEVIQDEFFLEQDPYPWQVPGGVLELQLSRWPLVGSAVVAFTGNTHSSIVVDGIANTAGITQGALVFGSGIPAGTTVATVAPNSVVLSQAATATATAVSLNTGLEVVQTLSSTQTQTLVYGSDFTIDAKKGWLVRLNPYTGVQQTWEAYPTTVTYQAGYAPIPPDLEDACLRLLTARYRARGRDPMLVERMQGQLLGTERYWIGSTPGQNGAFAPEIAALIEPYRVPVVA